MFIPKKSKLTVVPPDLQDCEQCILKNCTFTAGSPGILGESEPDKEDPIPPTNVELLAAELRVEPISLPKSSPPRINTSWQLRDSLAAKRIAANCHHDTCNWHIVPADPCDFDTCLLHAKHPTLCQCTEFLVKPSHSCEKGEFHFCKECYHAVVYVMGLPNMKIVTFRTRIDGEVSLAVSQLSFQHIHFSRSLTRVHSNTPAPPDTPPQNIFQRYAKYATASARDLSSTTYLLHTMSTVAAKAKLRDGIIQLVHGPSTLFQELRGALLHHQEKEDEECRGI